MVLKLPEITSPLSIDTVGKMLAMGHEATIHCLTTGCNHSSSLNLVALGRHIDFGSFLSGAGRRPLFLLPVVQRSRPTGQAHRPDPPYPDRPHPAWPLKR